MGIIVFILIHVSGCLIFDSRVEIVNRQRETVHLDQLELTLDYQDSIEGMFDNQLDIQKTNKDKKQYEFDVQIETISKQIWVLKRQLEHHNIKINADVLDQSMILNNYDKYDRQCPICFKRFRDHYFVLVHLIRIHFDDHLKMNYKNDFILIQNICEFMYCDKQKEVDRVELSRRFNKCSVFMQKLVGQSGFNSDDICYEIVFDDLKRDDDKDYVMVTIWGWMKWISYYLVIVGVMIYYYAMFGFYKKTRTKEGSDNGYDLYSYSSESD